MPQNKTRQILNEEYGVSPKTFRKKLKDYALHLPTGTVFPAYQKLIYETLGYPDGILAESYEKVEIPPIERLE